MTIKALKTALSCPTFSLIRRLVAGYRIDDQQLAVLDLAGSPWVESYAASNRTGSTPFTAGEVQGMHAAALASLGAL